MADELSFPRPFVLRRAEDVSGVSGTGDVAEGVVFSDGTVALRWRGGKASTVLWSSLDDAIAVHGHDGRTKVVFAEEAADAVLVQARRTAGGLQVKVAQQGREIRSMEDELGRLRPENAELRDRVRELESAAWAEMVRLGQELQEPPAA